MPRRWSYIAPLLGRILIGGFFLWNSIQEVTNFSATTEIFTRMNLSNPGLWAAAAVAIEALGGLALVTNTKSRTAALVLAVYVAATSVTLATRDTLASQIFLENLALIGGLLCISA